MFFETVGMYTSKQVKPQKMGSFIPNVDNGSSGTGLSELGLDKESFTIKHILQHSPPLADKLWMLKLRKNSSEIYPSNGTRKFTEVHNTKN